jgi:hypothetical protein
MTFSQQDMENTILDKLSSSNGTIFQLVLDNYISERYCNSRQRITEMMEKALDSLIDKKIIKFESGNYIKVKPNSELEPEVDEVISKLS